METSENMFEIFVGIDVSKLTLDVTILNPPNRKLHHKVFDNSDEGHIKLKDWLCQPQLYVGWAKAGQLIFIVRVSW